MIDGGRARATNDRTTGRVGEPNPTDPSRNRGVRTTETEAEESEVVRRSDTRDAAVETIDARWIRSRCCDEDDEGDDERERDESTRVRGEQG